jgi:hypothetical protein
VEEGEEVAIEAVVSKLPLPFAGLLPDAGHSLWKNICIIY